MNLDEILNKSDSYKSKKEIFEKEVEKSDKVSASDFVKESKAYVSANENLFNRIGSITKESYSELVVIAKSCDYKIQLNIIAIRLLEEEIKKLGKIKNDYLLKQAAVNSSVSTINLLNNQIEVLNNSIVYNRTIINKKIEKMEFSKKQNKLLKTEIYNGVQSINNKLGNEFVKYQDYDSLMKSLSDVVNKYPVLKESSVVIYNSISKSRYYEEEVNDILGKVEFLKNEEANIVKEIEEKEMKKKSFLSEINVFRKETNSSLFSESDKKLLNSWIDEFSSESQLLESTFNRSNYLTNKYEEKENLVYDAVSSVVNQVLIPQGGESGVFEYGNIFGDDNNFTFGVNSYSEIIENEADSYLKSWYEYLNSLLSNPQREFIIDKNNITNFKIVFRNPFTGLSTEKESLVQINHSISSNTKPVFGIGSTTYQAVSKGVRLMAGTIVVNAFENVPLAHLHSISYSSSPSPESLPPLDMYIIPIEDLHDGRFEALLIKGMKFMDLRQSDGASSNGRYYAFNFVAKDFIPVDFSSLGIL